MFLDDIAFRSLLSQGEHIKYVAHAHAFTIYLDLFKVLILGILAPAFGFYLFPPFLEAWLIWGGVGLALFSYRLLRWYLDCWIVTNMAVIDQDWKSFFEKGVTRIEFGNVEGISYEIKGFWGTILRYGDIVVEHMSGEPVKLEKVASPRKVERMIVRYQQEFQRQQNFSDHSKLKDLLANLLRSASK